MDIPSDLPVLPELSENTKFYVDGQQRYLKILATLSDSSGKINCAIFFSFDKDTASQPSKMSLWLLPLSEDTVAQSAGSQPRIQFTELTLRNQMKSVSDWNSYKVWSKGFGEDDPVILFPHNPATSRLDGGSWINITLDSATGTEFPIWKTNSVTERSIVFPAPQCHIINHEGKYIDYEIRIGIFKGLPVITIGEKPDKLANIKESPVYFSAKGCVVDVFGPRRLKPSDPERLEIACWLDVNPIEKELHSEGTKSYNLCREFTDKFDSYSSANPEIKSFFIAETDGKDSDKRKFFQPIYIRHYAQSQSNADTKGLFGLIGNQENQVVRIIQVNRKQKAALFVKVRSLGASEINSAFNSKTGSVKRALQNAKASAPVGLVPKISNFPTSHFGFISEWESPILNCPNESGEFNLVKTHFIKNGAFAESASAQVTLQLLRSQNSPLPSGEGIKLEAILALTLDATRVNDNGTLFEIDIKNYSLHSDTTIRDGALTFTLSAKADAIDNKRYGKFRCVLQLAKLQRPFFLWQWYAGIDDSVEASYAVEELSLPVINVGSGGQDMTNRDKIVAPSGIGAVAEGFGERSEPALIIPLNDKREKDGKPLYLLTFSESVNVGQDHRLDVRLQEIWKSAGVDTSSRVRSVVLDSNPQFTALIDASFLQQPGYDDGAWILARKSQLSEDAGGWELLDDIAETEGFKLVLPSQAIGEAYVKNEEPWPGEPAESDEVLQYRFGAPGILRLVSERLEKRYVAAPWNLRRIWGRAGQISPGIPLLKAQFELLYGLTGTLAPEKALIAELASKLGEVPLPPMNVIAWEPTKAQNDAFAGAWREYLEFYRAWQSRLAVLEPSAGDEFAGATFNKNLSFRPRIKLEELVNTPDGKIGTFKKTAGAELANPVDKSPKKQESVTDQDGLLENMIKAVHSPTGLAGGFNYGFESPAIYKEFWREAFKTGSSSAEVKALAFSSLGGWGKQTARFAGDKTIIKSNTTMGRTHFYAVERIGRIGVFWNRAKHVIEYERTVVPSEQFAHLPGHLGRPIVRKVREFVEILEPVRKYPDFVAGSQDAPGAVKECVFKSIIIPVLSTWGHDIMHVTHADENENQTQATAIGWEIPLYKLGADPRIYPKPQVQFALIPPPDSDEESVFVNLSEPQNLWFYTDAREHATGLDGRQVIIDDKVHLWPPVLNVDYTNIPEPPQYNISPAVGDSPKQMAMQLPAALDVMPGFERYTFRVDSNAIPASVAGRYYPESAITGSLRTVSMMRSVGKKKTHSPWPENNIYDHHRTLDALVYNDGSLLERTANGFSQLEAGITAGNIPNISEYQEKIKNNLERGNLIPLLKHSTGVSNPVLIHFQELWPKGVSFSFPVKWLWREALESSDGIVTSALRFYDDQMSKLITQLEILVAAGNGSVTDALEMLHQFEIRVMLFKTQIEYGPEQFENVSSLALDNFDKINDQLHHQIDNGIKDLFSLFDKISSETEITVAKSTIIEAIKTKLGQLRSIEATINGPWKELIGTDLKKWIDLIDTKIAEIHEATTIVGETVADLVSSAKAHISSQAASFKAEMSINSANLKVAYQTLTRNILDSYEGLNKEGKEVWDKVWKLFEADINKKVDDWKKLSAITKDTVKEFEIFFKNVLKTTLIATFNEILATQVEGRFSVHTSLAAIDSVIGSLEKAIITNLAEFLGANQIDYEKWLGTLKEYNNLQAALRTGNKDSILKASTALAESINKEYGRMAGEVAQKVIDAERLVTTGNVLVQEAQQTLTNFRSVWDEFTAPGMGLNRRTVAMIVQANPQEKLQRLSLTPCVSRVKQMGEQLDGMGLRLPVAAITDKLLSAKKEWTDMAKGAIENFGFSNVLSDIGGMRLDKLFPGFKMPEFARDKIKVTQGFDKQNLMAWANAEIDISLGEPQSLMSVGPMSITLASGIFTGKMRMEMGIDGSTKKTNTGELKGSWQIGVAGTPLMIFHDARVIFKDGKLTFDLDPKRMEMPGLLKTLTDATQTLSSSGAASNTDSDGNEIEVFKIGLLKVGEIPAGIQAQLNIPPISVGSGTSSLTNLSFGGSFMLSALDSNLQFRFLMGLGFYLGKKEAPFNLAVFILGGGGYVDCGLTYEPEKGLGVDFSMAVHASVALAVNMGWMRGGIAIMLGFEMEYHKKQNEDGSVYIAIYIHVLGNVDIMSVATIHLSLLLQATYKSMAGGESQLVGRGQVKCTIRLCRFVKIKVNKSYTKVFAGSGGSSGRSKLTQNSNGEKAQAILNSLA